MSTALKKDTRLLLMLLPAAVFFLAFFLLPMLRLFVIGGQGAQGWLAYLAIFTDAGYRGALFATLDPAAVRASASAIQVTAPRTKLNAAAMAMLADRVNSV